MEPYLKFQSAMARYFKAERNRTEQCLSDIVELLSSPGTAQDREDKIILRLVSHYDRQ